MAVTDEVLWNTTGEDPSLAYASYVKYTLRPETYIVSVVFTTIFITGVIGNGTLIFIFFKHRAMRTIPNTFVLSLAVGDILVMFFTVPFTGFAYTFESWPFGKTICIASEYVQHLSIGVSVFTLAVLSAERYWAIVDPLGKTLSRGSKGTLIIIVCIWIIAALIAIPIAVIASVTTYSMNVIHNDSQGSPYNTTIEILSCSPFPDEWQDSSYSYPQGYVACRFLVYYALPLLVIGFYYIRMARHLMGIAREFPGENSSTHRGAMLVRKKVAKMVLIFVLIFFICFAPHYIFSIWFWFHAWYNAYTSGIYTPFWNAFRILAFCLSYANSCVNPIALIFVSGTYRKYFKEYALRCLCINKSDSHRRALIERGTSMRTTKSEIAMSNYKLQRELSKCPSDC